MQEIIKKYKDKYIKYNGEIGSIEQVIYMILSYITGKTIAEIKLDYINIEKYIDFELFDKYMKKVFEENIPVQYIIGRTYLYNEEYVVSKDVLVPRQDTETLIEEAIKCINENNLETLLDLCTGSGAVGISISKNSNIKRCVLSDISKEALRVADKNIILNCAIKCKTIYSDMFKNINKIKVDIIVSNPPYISNKEMAELSNYVKNEPNIALRAGKLGLDFYECIYENSKKYLNNNGYILVEIGCLQANNVINIINKYSEYDNIEIIKDINGKDRVIKCHFHKI